jgi:hypothetical protein
MASRNNGKDSSIFKLTEILQKRESKIKQKSRNKFQVRVFTSAKSNWKSWGNFHYVHFFLSRATSWMHENWLIFIKCLLAFRQSCVWFIEWAKCFDCQGSNQQPERIVKNKFFYLVVNFFAYLISTILLGAIQYKKYCYWKISLIIQFFEILKIIWNFAGKFYYLGFLDN